MTSHALSTNPSMSTYTAPSASISHRSRLAHLISPLRRVIPRVPFWQLKAHRVPVLWGLCRGLLRSAPTQEVCIISWHSLSCLLQSSYWYPLTTTSKIRWKIQSTFRENRHLNSPAVTKTRMQRGYRVCPTVKMTCITYADRTSQLLNLCTKAYNGDERSKIVLDRYSRLLKANREKAELTRMLLDAKVRLPVPVLDTLPDRCPATGSHGLAPQPAHNNRLLPPHAVQQTPTASEAPAGTYWDDDRASTLEERGTQRAVCRAKRVASPSKGRGAI